jgi:hypothetical protein
MMMGEQMRYLCLVYAEETKLVGLSKAEGDELVRESLDYDDALRRSGHYIASHALQSPEKATSVRTREDDVSLTDGPFAETKEQLLGFILIEASDKAAATEVAAKIPMARYGTIEVRPIMELTRP